MTWKMRGKGPANNHFPWFHVFEDELNHRGQIRWLRKRATDASGRGKEDRRPKG